MVSRDSVRANMAFRERTTLESSPPEAISERGFNDSPTFGAIIKVAWSIPVSSMQFLFKTRCGSLFGSAVMQLIDTSNFVCGILSVANSFSIFWERTFAVCNLFSESFWAESAKMRCILESSPSISAMVSDIFSIPKSSCSIDSRC